MRQIGVVTLRLGVAIALGGCSDAGTQPVQPDPSGTYSVPYPTPGPLIYALPNCDRYLQYAINDLGSGSFDLAMNVFEDCRRTGNGYSSWMVEILGHYTVADTTVMFTPVSPGTQPFTGTFDEGSMRITVPARPDSLAAVPIQIELAKVGS